MSAPMNAPSLPSPADPRPRWQPLLLTVAGARVTVRDDAYSDRIRCDHPETTDALALGQALMHAAAERNRGRVVVLARRALLEGLEAAGLRLEATMPGFYCGTDDCVVLGAAIDPARAQPSDCREVDQLIRQRACTEPRPRPRVPTYRATEADAPELASLMAMTFEHYPTPSAMPDYLAKQIAGGTPFRFVRLNGQVVACASADLVAEAKTAELTDCATRPELRGGGFMQSILADLIDDLRAMGYPTAFTLARACVPGINLAFQRLGFDYRGRMIQSCRIGSGIEDMNVWSRRL